MASPTKGDKKEEDRTIQVFLRVRPPTAQEKTEGHSYNNLQLVPSDPALVNLTTSGDKQRQFKFNRVFGPDSAQEDVYNSYAQQAVESALNGYHGVLFVYGQTGSGKTYTISNEEAGKEGTLQRAVKTTWDRIHADAASEYSCSVSYVQLYNEILTDMLEDPNANNHVRISGVSDKRSDISLISERTGQQVDREVNSYEETMAMFNLGASRKHHAKTNMNENSSRSHTIFTLIIKRRQRATAAASGTAPRALEGRLILCDLAGSERISKTKAEGSRVTEASHINGSLLVLGKVVSALTEKSSQHVPFRESKLTRVLQYSLSGYGKTSIVVNVGPSDYNTEETLTAIQFGQRAIQIKQTAQQHQILDYKALYVQLQGQLDQQLEGAVEAAVAEERREFETTIKNLKDRISLLEEENKMLLSHASGKVNPLSGAAFETHNMQMLRQVGEERDRLRGDLATAKEASAQDKTQLFTVARKFEAFRTNVLYERGELMNRINDLEAELAAAKGLSYMAPTMAADADAALDDLMKTARGGASGASSARGEGGALNGSFAGPPGGAPPLEEQLDRAFAAIRILRDERVQLLLYQEKAKQAIRRLASQQGVFAPPTPRYQ